MSSEQKKNSTLSICNNDQTGVSTDRNKNGSLITVSESKNLDSGIAKSVFSCAPDEKSQISCVGQVALNVPKNELRNAQVLCEKTRTAVSKTMQEKAVAFEKVGFSEEESVEIVNSISLPSSETGKCQNVPVHSQSQRPKSVSFHTGSSLPLERKISNALDCLRYMINGSSLIKVRASSRQYRRFFTLEEDLSALRWIPSSKKTSKARLSIRCMREVRMGKSTDVLRSKEITGSYSEDCAFSIIYNDSFESLDLIASTPDEANIWVTGLNVLIGASRSPDTFDERQKMREKWLRDVFDQADIDQKGLLSECETISLMKKLNNQLSTVRLHQKIMEFEHGKLGEERGRIDSSDFVNIFKETSTRPEIYFLLVRFSGKDYMTLEDLQLFLEGEQGMHCMDAEKCLMIIEQYEPSEEAKKNKQLLIDGTWNVRTLHRDYSLDVLTQEFQRYNLDIVSLQETRWTDKGFTSFLISESCDILDPAHKTVCQDMSKPFSHYFISTSHNTYLLEDQLKGPSGVEGYITALKMGCRCVKVDCWDGTDGPVVYHGNTLTSKIPLQEVLETIKEFGFVSSFYPLIIHLENHCSLANQQRVSSLMTSILSDQLYIPGRDGSLDVPEMTPEHFKWKILIKENIQQKSKDVNIEGLQEKGKKLSPYCNDAVGEVSDEDEDQDCTNSKDVLRKIKLSNALSDLVSLTRMRFWNIEMTEDIQKLSDVSSFSEVMASKLSHLSPEDLINHNKQFLTHVFPNSSRVDSSNYNPLEYWSCGCQLVAMNFQTAGHMMDLYQGWFQQNGCCGYVLKPTFFTDQLCLFSGGSGRDPVPGLEATTLYVKVISAQQLPQPKGASSKASAIDPYIVVQVYGIPIDCAEARTRTVSNEGHSPIFDESFEFTVTVPQLAMLRIAVLDDEFIGDDFIGQFTIPLLCLQTGYRHLRLLSNSGDPLSNTTLFIYVTMTTRSEKQRTRRKKAWLNLKPVGIKQADDVFKNAATPLAEAYKMRVDEEQAMLELCKECGVSDSANIVQCLRVLTLRMASCPGITDWEIINENEVPVVKVCGELTACLSKTMSMVEKVLAECNYIKENADSILQSLTDLLHVGESVWDEIVNHSNSNVGSKGRKAEKVMENFLWNMTVLTSQTDLLKALRDQCFTSVQQLSQLGSVFSKLFLKERESITTANESNPVVTPVLTSQINLMPFPQQPPLTPTSPGDGRLRGILKKTSTPSTPPVGIAADRSESNGAATSSVFFPVHPTDNTNRRFHKW